MELSKSTIIEGVASTEAKDSQGESLDLNGADISALLEGRGFVNSDHSNRFEHLVGRVLDAKKVQSIEDCETSQQMKYYSEKKKPFLWAKLELWDGHGHKEADAISSIYNYYQDRNQEPPIKLSVEGKTLERGKGGLLKRTIIKGVALTVHPANKTTKTDVVGIVKSAGAPMSLVKSESDTVPIFIEEKDRDPAERILDLAVQARHLIREAKSVQKSESSKRPLKCQESLERFKEMKAEKSV